MGSETRGKAPEPENHPKPKKLILGHCLGRGIVQSHYTNSPSSHFRRRWIGCARAHQSGLHRRFPGPARSPPAGARASGLRGGVPRQDDAGRVREVRRGDPARAGGSGVPHGGGRLRLSDQVAGAGPGPGRGRGGRGAARHAGAHRHPREDAQPGHRRGAAVRLGLSKCRASDPVGIAAPAFVGAVCFRALAVGAGCGIAFGGRRRHAGA